MLEFLYVAATIAATVEADKTDVNVPPPVPPRLVPPPAPPTPLTSLNRVPNLGPNPRNRRWVSATDYPALALREEREGTTGIMLKVTKWGSVADCTVIASSGHADLDEKTCESAAYRGRFWPATDDKGRPISGEYSTNIRWQIPDKKDETRKSTHHVPRLYSPTDRFPKSPRMRGYFGYNRYSQEKYPPLALKEKREGTSKLALAISRDDKLQDCKVTETSGHADLDKASCDLIRDQATFTAARDIDGNPVAGRITTGVVWTLPQVETPPPKIVAKPIKPRRNSLAVPGTLRVEFNMKKDGSISDCKGKIEGLDKFLSENERDIGRLCNIFPEMSGRRPIEPIKDENGTPVDRRVTLEFSLRYDEIGQ